MLCLANFRCYVQYSLTLQINFDTTTPYASQGCTQGWMFTTFTKGEGEPWEDKNTNH